MSFSLTTNDSPPCTVGSRFVKCLWRSSGSSSGSSVPLTELQKVNPLSSWSRVWVLVDWGFGDGETGSHDLRFGVGKVSAWVPGTEVRVHRVKGGGSEGDDVSGEVPYRRNTRLILP